MGKYIIELERGETAYKTVNSNGKPLIQLLAPIPYTEPDLEQVRKGAFKNGYDAACKDIDIKSKTNAAYRNGLEDAWECARKIVDCTTPYEVLENYLKIGECTADVIKHLLASKAIEVVRQYEQEKEEKGQESITAEDVMRQYLDTFCKEQSCSGCPLNTPDFTCGRGYHFLTATKPVSDEEVRRAYAKVCKR